MMRRVTLAELRGLADQTKARIIMDAIGYGAPMLVKVEQSPYF